MNDQKSMRKGIIGASIAALCCFTPVLVVLFGFAGLSAYIGGLDYFLFPMLFGSLGFIAFTAYLNAGSPGVSPKSIIIVLVFALSLVLFWLKFRYALRISIGATLAVVAYGFYLRSASKQAAA